LPPGPYARLTNLSPEANGYLIVATKYLNSDYVQYGCGFCAPERWLNFDASPTLRWERLPLLGRLYTRNVRRFPRNVRYGDIVRGLPVAAGSCRAIYCSHILEHLAFEDFDTALSRTFQYLKAGGVFRLVVPDLEHLARDYVASPDPCASIRFMEAAHLGRKQRQRSLHGFLTDWLGNSMHQWMWDEKSLAKKLREHGFVNIRRAQFGDAEDQRFNEVEECDRFVGCLAMQCVKEQGSLATGLSRDQAGTGGPMALWTA